MDIDVNPASGGSNLEDNEDKDQYTKKTYMSVPKIAKIHGLKSSRFQVQTE